MNKHGILSKNSNLNQKIVIDVPMKVLIRTSCRSQ